MLTNTERLRLLARLFTRPVFSSLAQRGKWQHSLAFLKNYGLLESSRPRPLSLLFDQAWEEIKIGYRNEYVYKNEIANRILFGRHRPHTASFHVEMPIGNSIVDVAVFNGTSTAYEVKTEYDSARRLETQTADYLKAFEHVYVVAHPSLAQDYCGVVREGVGVMALSQRGSLATIKKAKSNIQALHHRTIFRCLRREEYVSIIREASGQTIDLPNGLIADECNRVFGTLEIDLAHSLYVKALRERKIGLQNANFMSTLPTSLRAVGYATPLSERQRSAITDVLNECVPVALA